MSQQIGDALVSAIEQVDISASSSSSEINLTDVDKQFLVDGENQGEDIEITFYIIGEEFDSIQDIEDQVKSLTSNPVNRNVLDYQDNKGFISVDSVSIPESSSTQNLRQGTVSGKFLSFPQNFPEESFIVLISSTFSFDGEISGDISSQKSVSTEVRGNLDSSGKITVSKILESDIDSFFVIGSGYKYSSDEYGSKLYGREYTPLSSYRKINSDLKFTLGINNEYYGSEYGKAYSSSGPPLTVEKLLGSSFEGKLQSEGSLTVEKLLSSDVDSYLVLGGGDEYSSGEYNSDLYGRKFVPLSSERAFEGDLDSTLEIQSGLYGFNYGNSYSSEEPVLSFVLSISGSVGGDLQADGTLEDITEISYGYDYGSDYGGYMTDYGANIYGRNTYSN